MTDENYNLHDDDTGEHDDNPVRAQREHIKRLEAQARTAAEAQKELALYKAGLGDLNDDQRAALLAVVKDDVNPESLKAKAAALFGNPSEPTPANPAEAAKESSVTAELGAFERAAQATAGAGSPGPAPDKLAEVRRKVASVGPQQLAALHAEAMQAIQEAGLEFGTVQHDGTFTPIQ